MGKKILEWKSFLTFTKFQQFIESLPLKTGKTIYFHTENNTVCDDKLRGHPFFSPSAWHDWATAMIENKSHKVHILPFVRIPNNAIHTHHKMHLHKLTEGGDFALTHHCPPEADFPNGAEFHGTP